MTSGAFRKFCETPYISVADMQTKFELRKTNPTTSSWTISKLSYVFRPSNPNFPDYMSKKRWLFDWRIFHTLGYNVVPGCQLTKTVCSNNWASVLPMNVVLFDIANKFLCNHFLLNHNFPCNHLQASNQGPDFQCQPALKTISFEK